MPRKSIYLFLLSGLLCSVIIGLRFGSIIIIGALAVAIGIVLFINRGVIITLRANKLLANKEFESGYKLLRKAYLTDTIPFIVVNGYIFLSLKHGYLDNAWEAINRILNGNASFKIKPRHRKETLNNKALYYWATDELEKALEIMNELYSEGFANSNFYGSYGCLLTEVGEFEKAEKVINESLEFDPGDKVSLDNRVSLYIKLEKWEDAKKVWEELEDLFPRFPDAWFHGAQVEYHLGNKDRAKELLEEAKERPIFNLSTISNSDIDELESKL